jgi:hypothetical protein
MDILGLGERRGLGVIDTSRSSADRMISGAREPVNAEVKSLDARSFRQYVSTHLLSSGRVPLRAVPTHEDRTANSSASIRRNRDFRLCQRHVLS